MLYLISRALQEAQDIFGVDFNFEEFGDYDEEEDFDEEYEDEEEEGEGAPRAKKTKKRATKKSIFDVSPFV